MFDYLDPWPWLHIQLYTQGAEFEDKREITRTFISVGVTNILSRECTYKFISSNCLKWHFHGNLTP